MNPDNLVKKLNNVHHIVQEIEFSGLSDALTEDEYAYIYAALEDAREFIAQEAK